MKLDGRLITLKPWTKKDEIPEQYLEWMNDVEVTRFLESKFVSQNEDTIRRYVDNMIENLDIWFWGIKDKADVLVGNIKLGPVNRIHRFSEIGLVIGKPWWGKGYGTEALKLASDFGFETLGLHKIFGGILDGNTASMKAFAKAGFYLEAELVNQYWDGKEYIVDSIYSRFAR